MAYIQRDAIQTINFSDLSGGINISRPPNLIAENECQEATNVEFVFNKLKVRDGLSAPITTYSSNIQSVFYIPFTNSGVVVLDNGSVYEDDFNGGSMLVGSLTGTKRPSFCRYDNKTFIASGGKLQYIEFPEIGSSTSGIRVTVNSVVSYYDETTGRFVADSSIFSTTSIGTNVYKAIIASSYSTTHTLKTINDAPNCSIVFERAGRLVVANAGSDRIHYSAVGNPYEATEADPVGTENPHTEGWYEWDATNELYVLSTDTTVVSGKTYYLDVGGWQEETDIDSSYKWIDVGYKADGDILSVIPMASDLLIFKSGGTVYSLASEYPNWTITEVTKNTDVVSSNCVAPIPNAVAYVSARGLFGINTSVAYGNFNINEIGFKINKAVAYKTKLPRVYMLSRKSQLLVCPDTLLYPNKLICYHWSLQAFTRIDFPDSLGALKDIADTIDGPIVAIGNKLYRWIEQYSTDNGTPIESSIKTRVVLGVDKIIARAVDSLMTASADNQTASIKINDIERAGHTINVSVPTNARKKVLCNHSSRKVQLEVTANSRYELEHLALEATGFSR